MKRVLVAGATGYLGRHVVRELKARGYRVRALIRTPEKLAELRVAPDELHFGEVTQRSSLAGICDGIDVVFSCVGITRQQNGRTFRDVDYQGNLNLLECARQAGVKKFVYVSLLDGPHLRHLDIVAAHEDFVDELRHSGLEHTVVRPTGFFSDMGEVFDMARRGRVYLFGSGSSRINPIHGADLAVRCADAIEQRDTEVVVGGPQVLSWRQIAELAFEAQHKPPKITRVPVWLAMMVIFLTRIFSRHSAGLMAFFTTMGTRDVVGPSTGKHTLSGHFQELGQRTEATAVQQAG